MQAEALLVSVAALQAENLHKVYAKNGVPTYALRGVSFAIEAGEFTAIVGPSGSGKSTLLNLLGTLDRPTEGRVWVDGVDTSTLSGAELALLRNAKIGFVFQSFNLVPRLSALENVTLPLRVRAISNVERRERALRVLEQVGLLQKALNRPGELSGGEQQRVALGRALVTDPAIILGDEPTGNLDTKTTVAIVDLLRRLNQATGKTFLLITHNPEVSRRTRRIIYLRDGEIEREEEGRVVSA